MYTTHAFAAMAVLFHSVSALPHLPQALENVFERALSSPSSTTGPAPTGFYSGKGPVGTAPLVTATGGTAPLMTGTGTAALGTGTGIIGTGTGIGTGTIGTGTAAPGGGNGGTTYHFPGSKPATSIASIPSVVIPGTDIPMITTAQPANPTDTGVIPGKPAQPVVASTETSTITNTVTSTVTMQSVVSTETMTQTVTSTVQAGAAGAAGGAVPSTVTMTQTQTATQTVTVTEAGATCPTAKG